MQQDTKWGRCTSLTRSPILNCGLCWGSLCTLLQQVPSSKVVHVCQGSTILLYSVCSHHICNHLRVVVGDHIDTLFPKWHKLRVPFLPTKQRQPCAHTHASQHWFPSTCPRCHESLHLLSMGTCQYNA